MKNLQELIWATNTYEYIKIRDQYIYTYIWFNIYSNNRELYLPKGIQLLVETIWTTWHN